MRKGFDDFIYCMGDGARHEATRPLLQPEVAGSKETERSWGLRGRRKRRLDEYVVVDFR